jgi:hypothetical protein
MTLQALNFIRRIVIKRIILCSSCIFVDWRFKLLKYLIILKGLQYFVGSI